MCHKQVLLSKDYLELLISPGSVVHQVLYPILSPSGQEQGASQIPSPTNQLDNVDEWIELLENIEMSSQNDTHTHQMLTLDVFSLNSSTESPEATILSSPEQISFEDNVLGSFNF